MQFSRLTMFFCTAILVAGCFTRGEPGSDFRPSKSGSCGCDGEALPQKEPARDNEIPDTTIRIAMASEPGILLSLFSTSPDVRQIVNHEVNESLVATDPVSGEIAPELASSWTVDEAGTTVTFTLVPGVKWHDGASFSAADVVFTFQLILDSAGGTTLHGQFLDVAKIEALDDLTVQVYLDSPRPDFVASLSEVSILPRHVFENTTIVSHPAARAPVGTGPFLFSSWQAGKSISLKRNPSWRGVPPSVKQLDYYFVSDGHRAMAMFEKGELDILPDAAFGTTPTGGYVRRVARSRFTAWIYNHTLPIFSSPLTRKALSASMDRESIRCSVLQCLAKAVNSPFPDRIVPDTRRIFSPKIARTLLRQAGFRDREKNGILEKNGIPFAFTLLTADPDRNDERTLLVIQHDLKKTGIQMEISSVSSAVFAEKLRSGRFEAALVSLDNRAPYDPVPMFHSKGADNSSRMASPEIDKILSTLRQGETLAQQNAQKDRFIEALYREEPVSFLFQPFRNLTIQKTVGGVTLRGDELDERFLFRAKAPAGEP